MMIRCRTRSNSKNYIFVHFFKHVDFFISIIVTLLPLLEQSAVVTLTADTALDVETLPVLELSAVETLSDISTLTQVVESESDVSRIK